LQKRTEQYDVVSKSRTSLCAMVFKVTIEAATSCSEKISVIMTELTQTMESEAVDWNQPSATINRGVILEGDEVMMIERHV
jgi:hypothetical protein